MKIELELQETITDITPHIKRYQYDADWLNNPITVLDGVNGTIEEHERKEVVKRLFMENIKSAAVPVVKPFEY